MKVSKLILLIVSTTWFYAQSMQQLPLSSEQFLEAVRSHNIADVQRYLDEHGNVNYQDEKGNTALHYAFALGDAGKDIINILVTNRPGDQLLQLQNSAGLVPAQMAPAGYLESAGYYAWMPVSAAQWTAGKLWEYTGGAASTSWEYTKGAAQWSGQMAMAGARGAYSYGECAAHYLQVSYGMWDEISEPDAHSAESASVALTISDLEKEYLEQRALKSKETLQAFLQKPVDFVPSVGFCFSGGGYRAMLETLGWLSGVERLGILDAGVYMTGLSGSTWALNPLVASNLSLQEYKKQLLPRLTKTLQAHVQTMKDEDIKDIIIMLGRKYYQNLSIGPVDIFGAILAHMLLGKHGEAVPQSLVEKPYLYPLSLLAPSVRASRFPLPISTAVLGGTLPHEVRPTVEFSPFTIGGFELNGFIPTWSFGRLFENGISQPIIKKAGGPPFYGTELPLGYLMGTFGSAFAVDMHNIMLELLKRLIPENVCPRDVNTVHSIVTVLKAMAASSFAKYTTRITEMIKTVPPEMGQNIEGYLKDEHYGAAWVNNLLYKLTQNRLADRQQLSLVDGGFSLVEHDRLNIAIMPLLYRNLDVITICDSSWDLKGSPSLKAAERAARILKLKFPKINYENIDTTIASMFIDEEDPSVPIIVYMPGIANKAYDATFNPVTSEFTGTFNFTYTPEQAQLLMGLLEFNVLQSADILRTAFEKAIERKKSRSGWMGTIRSWWSGNK